LASISILGYQPEDLKIQVLKNGKALEVSGQHEEKSEDGKVILDIHFTNTFWGD
jgi:HSP20 family molecular chaperone IbpA